MTEASFRSRYAGLPGSLVAIRVDYARNSAAFDNANVDARVESQKRDVKRWKMGHRLGDKAEWNQSTQPAGYVGGAPQRPLLHQLSEFQGVKLDYNYRASTLPAINKSTRFVPKPSKLQVDRSIFMSPAERSLLVDRNAGTTTMLSRKEMTNEGVPGAEREAGWNTSVALDKERSDIYRLRTYEDLREINKTKSVLDHGTYVTPQRRQAAIMKAQREQKLAQREEEAKARAAREAARHPHSAPSHAAGAAPQPVFKMSNIDQWWDPEFDQKVVATASAVLGRPVVIDGVASAAASSKPTGEADGAPAADP